MDLEKPRTSSPQAVPPWWAKVVVDSGILSSRSIWARFVATMIAVAKWYVQ